MCCAADVRAFLQGGGYGQSSTRGHMMMHPGRDEYLGGGVGVSAGAGGPSSTPMMRVLGAFWFFYCLGRYVVDLF